MALHGRQCYLIFLVIVMTSALEVSELDLDTALNPRLVGAIYHLYKPTTPTKVQPKPIVIDCNHPSIVCKFGSSSMLVTPDKECNCKDTTAEVPIIAGLAPQTDKDTIKVTEKTGVSELKDKDSGVPIFNGVVNTNAILNEGEQPYNVWNFQRNSMDKGWRPSQDPIKTRIGGLPAKFTSYYPFSPPKMPDFSEDSNDRLPDFPPFPYDKPDDSHYVLWRKPGASNNKTPRPTSTPSGITNSPKLTTNKASTTVQPSSVTPKRSV